VKIDVAAKSDLGLKRSNNEDAYVALPEVGLFVVCDGMGGLNAGEVASRLAVEVIQREVTAPSSKLHRPENNPRFSEATNRLGHALAAANLEIYHAAQDRAEWEGMGTTAVAALLTDNRLSIAHAGDSRLYLIRENDIQQLTPDHSYVGEQVRLGRMTEAEAMRSPYKNVITRALGPHRAVDIELSELSVIAGDCLVLCSDGLTNEVSASDIKTVVHTHREAQQAADRLIAVANAAGGNDNTTVIVIFIHGD
jgi:serine/threonine protein phosphatase PrpC